MFKLLLEELERIETRFNRSDRDRNYTSCEVKNKGQYVFSMVGNPLSKGDDKELSFQDWRRARIYILKNYDEV